MDGDTRLQFQWFPLDEQRLAKLPLFPSFLASGLTKLPPTVTHVIHRDTMPAQNVNPTPA